MRTATRESRGTGQRRKRTPLESQILMRFRPISVQRVQALLTHFARWADSLVERFLGRVGTMPHEICRDDRAGAAAVFFTLDLSPHGKDAPTVASVRAA